MSHKPTSHDYAYLAGLLDSRGFFHKRRRDRTVTLRIISVDFEQLQWCQSRFGGRLTVRRGASANCRDQLVWSIARREDLQRILEECLPRLKSKKPVARKILAFLDVCEQIADPADLRRATAFEALSRPDN